MREHEFLDMVALLAVVLLVGLVALVNPLGIDEYVQRVLGGLAGQGSCPNNGWGHPSC